MNRPSIERITRAMGLLPLILVPIVASAQFNETIRTGRPGQAIGPFAVGAHVLQLQTGVEYAGSRHMSKHTRYVEPGAVLRFGLGRTFEVNTGWAWRSARYETEKYDLSASGITASSVGFRVNITEGKGALPAIGFQFTGKLPIDSDVRKAVYFAPRYLLVASRSITNKLSVLVNVGADHNGTSAEPTGVYVLNLSYGLAPKWSTFVENYGSFGPAFENRWDTGIAYLANDNLQWDLYGGYGENHGIRDFFFNAGLSYRFLTSPRTTT